MIAKKNPTTDQYTASEASFLVVTLSPYSTTTSRGSHHHHQITCLDILWVVIHVPLPHILENTNPVNKHRMKRINHPAPPSSPNVRATG